jgi:hypothetical protein
VPDASRMLHCDTAQWASLRVTTPAMISKTPK